MLTFILRYINEYKKDYRKISLSFNNNISFNKIINSLISWGKFASTY